MMSVYRYKVLIVIVLMALLMPRSGNSQLNMFQYTRKRSAMSTVHKYCGKNLSNALKVVCDGVYNQMFKKSGQEMEMDDYPFPYDDSYPFRSRASANAMMGRFGGARLRRQSRGVYDECCIKACSLDEMSNYCGRR